MSIIAGALYIVNNRLYKRVVVIKETETSAAANLTALVGP